jgi:hypothetical protein
MLPSAPTLHVVGTEMVVGAFALSGACFMLCLFGALNIWKFDQLTKKVDVIAHGAIVFGLLATPMAILSGIQSSPGENVQSSLLATKLFLSMSGIGLALAVLMVRKKFGYEVWSNRMMAFTHALVGMAAVGTILLTASLGGRFSRGESLLDFAHLPYDTLFLAPIWLSIVLLTIGVANIVLYVRTSSAIEH